MKTITIVCVALLTTASLQSQITHFPAGIPICPEGKTISFSGAYAQSNGFFRSNFCMSSINTGTYNVFMEWLMNRLHWPGMQVGILHNGELIWKNNYGLANIEQAKPVTDETEFRLFSVSKTLVATAMMKLVEDGLVNLNGNINDYLPFTVTNPWYPAAIVSPKMVLTHAASLSDIYPGSGPQCGAIEYLGDPQVSLNDFLVSHYVSGGSCYANVSYLNAPPGTTCIYSNPGASLGGYIVEAVTGTGFNEFCNDSIFNKLDMPNSRWFYAELDTADMAMIYTWNGSNLVPYGFRSWVDYPCAEVKSNVTELANYLKMYLHHGMYNGTRILDSASVEQITTVYDTVSWYNSPGTHPIGLIWWYWPPNNTWFHTGARGASLNFNKEENTGCILLGNGGQFENEPYFTLNHFMSTFSEFAVSFLEATDDDGDGILENGETIGVVAGIYNNLMSTAENVHLTLHCSDPGFQLIDSVATLADISSGQSATNQGQPFRFHVSNVQTPHQVMMDIELHYNTNQTEVIHFPLFAGKAEVLLVKDERDVLNSERFYLDVLDSLGCKTQYWDIAVSGNPDTTFLKNFRAVIWYTGYDMDSTVSEVNQYALKVYLNQGGRLFMTGQNISDEIGNTDFMSNYLHASHVDNTFYLQIIGISGDPLGDGLGFYLNGGYEGMYNQYSQSRILPVNGGTGCFKYPTSTSMAGVRYDNSIYKTVFLGFGFEGIDLISNRYILMKRILEYFDVSVGNREPFTAVNEPFEIKLVPNPASEKLTVNFSLSKQQDITIQLFDMTGRELVNEIRMKEQPGKRIVTLQLGQLEAGAYLVCINGQQQRTMKKLVVVK